MAYHNPHSIGYQVESSLGAYNLNDGDRAFYVAIAEPMYARRAYIQSENESMADLKYSRLEIGYDRGLRNFHDAVRGPPIEAYVPRSSFIPDGGAIPMRVQVMPKKSIMDEIRQAQEKVITKLRVEIEENISITRSVKIRISK